MPDLSVKTGNLGVLSMILKAFKEVPRLRKNEKLQD
jgi:hypothetical protein